LVSGLNGGGKQGTRNIMITTIASTVSQVS